MRHRRSLLATFWGNVLLIPLLGLAMYYTARQDNRWYLALFWLAFSMTVNCASNLGIIASVEHDQTGEVPR